MKLNENSLKLYKLSLLLVWEDCVASYGSYTNDVSIVELLTDLTTILIPNTTLR